jgi:HSP20 family protein
MVTQMITAPETGDQDAFTELHKLGQSGGSAFKLDAYETGSVIELTAEVPGARDQDVAINLAGNVLTISVEKRPPDEGKRKHFSERSYGRLERSIQLPFAPDGKSVTADLENGVLTIRFPRAEAERAQRIAIGGTRSTASRERRAIGSSWEQKLTSEEPLTLTNMAGPGAARPTGSTAPKTPSGQ